MPLQSFSDLPPDSVGLGLRRAHFDDWIEALPDVDFLEVITENFMDFGGRPKRILNTLRQRYPILTHGVSLSVGGPEPISDEQMQPLRALADELGVPFVSDHICYSAAESVHYHDLIPLPLSNQSIEHLAKRIEAIKEALGYRLVLENPSYYFAPPGSHLSEAEFLVQLLHRADFDLLLDINNVYVNARNHGFDAFALIDALPSERIAYLHLAGHDDSGPFIIDTHNKPLCQDVWELYRFCIQKHGPKPTLLEWDADLPPLLELVQLAHEIKAVMQKTHQESAQHSEEKEVLV